MAQFDDYERMSQVEETIRNHGIHIAAGDLLLAMEIVTGDAKHAVKGFELTPAYDLMLKQVAVIKDACNKINKLRATIA